MATWLGKKMLMVPSGPLYGPELMTNSELTANTTGYTASSATISRVDSTTDPAVISIGADAYCLKVEATGSNARARLAPLITVEVGKQYRIAALSFATTSGNKAGISYTDGSTAFNLASATYVSTYGAWELLELVVEATSTTLNVVMAPRSAAVNSIAGDTAYFDAISVKEVL